MISSNRDPKSTPSASFTLDHYMEEHLTSIAMVGPSHWWHQHRFELVAAALPKGSASILDFGCGTGMFLGWLNGKYPDVYQLSGFDPSAAQASHDSQSLDHRPFMSLRSWPPKEGQLFDAIVLMDVLEHLDDDLASLKSLVSALKPGGKLIITVPAYGFLWSRWDEQLGHRRSYHPHQLGHLLTGAGLILKRMTCLFPLLVLPAYFRKFMIKKNDHSAPRFSPPHPAVQRLLNLVCTAERRWLQKHDIIFGTSILAVGQRGQESGLD